jgi:CheY-like chemotaxis protein
MKCEDMGRLEREAESNAQGFFGLLDCLLDPMFIVSAEDATIIHCNSAALTWQGCQSSDLVGHPFNIFLAEPKDASREDLLAQIRVHHWAGQDWIAVHLRDAEQRIAAQKMECQLREAAARERTVAQLNHEINNPLQALLMRTEGDSDDTIRDPVERIAVVLRKLQEEQGDQVSSTSAVEAAGPLPDKSSIEKTNVQRVLIVDDYDMIRRMLGIMVGRKLPGVQVDLAADGEEAVELFKKGHPAVVVLDIMMPKRNGDIVFEEMKAFCQQQHWEEPRVVFCTGYTLPPAVRAEVEGPGSRHLCIFKPVEPAKLVKTVALLLADIEAERGRPRN